MIFLLQTSILTMPFIELAIHSLISILRSNIMGKYSKVYNNNHNNDNVVILRELTLSVNSGHDNFFKAPYQRYSIV